MMYTLDTGFEPAKNTTELRQQNAQIQKRENLSDFDVAYLLTKNNTRYFAAMMSRRGLGGDILNNAIGRTFSAGHQRMQAHGGTHLEYTAGRFAISTEVKNPDIQVTSYQNSCLLYTSDAADE